MYQTENIPTYNCKAKEYYRSKVFKHTLKNEDLRKTHSVAYFDATDGNETKFWRNVSKRVVLHNIERSPELLDKWYQNGIDSKYQVDAFNMSSTSYINFNIQHTLYHLDYIGFMSKDKMKDMSLIDTNRSAKYVVINIHDIKGIRHRSNQDLRNEIKANNIKDANRYFIKKSMPHYEIVESFSYKSKGRSKKMKCFIMRLKESN